MRNPSVTVVVPAWNEQDCIGATIDALKAQTYSINIIVVDDASTDDTAKVARDRGVTVLSAPKQGSKSQALNYALPHVTTDLFICVDADTVLATNAIERLTLAFEDPRNMVACGFVQAKNCGNFWQSARSVEYDAIQKIAKSAQNKWKMVLVASGCFFAIKTDYLKFKQGFPNRTLAEDMDLTWTAIEEGYEVAFVEDAMCWVDDPFNFWTYRKQVERWFRGYFQNIRCRNFNLFRNRFKLGLIAYIYLVFNVISIPTLIGLAFVQPIMIAKAFALSFAILYAFYVWYGKEGVFKSVLSTCNMLACSILNQYIFVRSAWLELVKGEQLDVWVKGH